MTEALLIDGLRKGDERAFVHLVDQYQQVVGNTCFGFVQNQVEAEELTQDVFVEVFRSIEKFQGQSKLSTWLYRIAVNKSLNQVAKRKQKRRLQTVSHFFGFGEAAEAREFKDTIHRQPEEELEQAEIRVALRTALNKLPEQQRTAFVLRKYDDLSYTEIARIMDTSVAAVESLIHRASRNMRKKLTHFYQQYQ
ncbi:MAG: sigma-70 family RNA polymerase sigma factor [Bacteroidota bacterium]